MNLKSFLQGFGLFAILLTLIPIVAADFWWIRIFDYPHTQLTILTLVAIVTYFIKFNVRRIQDYIFVIVLVGCFIFQLVKISPYLPHGNYAVGEATTNNDDNNIKFYAANVLQKNTNPNLLIEEINIEDPDILLLTETDSRWVRDLKSTVSKYPYQVEVPLDNTYGMLLYSKFRLENPQVKFLVDDSIPSIHSVIQLKSGKRVQLYAIHPTPPMPQHNPKSTDRDAEMFMVAKLALDSKLPVIVAGDFNDVSWAGSTTLFQNVGKLLDVRVGRGFYNTFTAKNPIMRWPLDHFFVTEEFRVADLQTGKDIDSDHFPFYVTLQLEPKDAEEQEPDQPTENQLKRANEEIEQAKEEQSEKKSKGE